VSHPRRSQSPETDPERGLLAAKSLKWSATVLRWGLWDGAGRNQRPAGGSEPEDLQRRLRHEEAEERGLAEGVEAAEEVSVRGHATPPLASERGRRGIGVGAGTCGRGGGQASAVGVGEHWTGAHGSQSRKRLRNHSTKRTPRTGWMIPSDRTREMSNKPHTCGEGRVELT
jgi:hypothetical protein